MRHALLITLLLLSASVRSQDLEGQISGIVASIVNSREQLSQKVDYSGITDSVAYAVVSDYVNRSVQEGTYSWPFWYFQWTKDADRKVEAIPPYPTETGKYLLQHKYRIGESSVSNGCIWQHAYVVHDSLMAEAIRKKYGNDFFRKYQEEADDLDQRGLGLTLPFIKNKQKTTATLENAYGYVKELPSKERSSDESCYLMFQFDQGKVKRVFVCRKMFYVQQDLSLMEESDRLTAIAQKLSWTPPKFKGLPVKATIIYDLTQKELSFYRSASFF